MNRLWWWEEKDEIETGEKNRGESLVRDMFVNGLGGEYRIDGKDKGE